MITYTSDSHQIPSQTGQSQSYKFKKMRPPQKKTKNKKTKNNVDRVSEWVSKFNGLCSWTADSELHVNVDQDVCHHMTLLSQNVLIQLPLRMHICPFHVVLCRFYCTHPILYRKRPRVNCKVPWKWFPEVIVASLGCVIVLFSAGCVEKQNVMPQPSVCASKEFVLSATQILFTVCHLTYAHGCKFYLFYCI